MSTLKCIVIFAFLNIFSLLYVSLKDVKEYPNISCKNIYVTEEVMMYSVLIIFNIMFMFMIKVKAGLILGSK
jgi:hypothetical protein